MNRSGSSRSAARVAIDGLLADGELHDFREVQSVAARLIAPVPALRRLEGQRRWVSQKRNGEAKPRQRERSVDDLVFRGSWAVARDLIQSGLNDGSFVREGNQLRRARKDGHGSA